MNIYLDIDGTLIYEDGHRAGEPAAGLAEFIQALFPLPLPEGEMSRRTEGEGEPLPERVAALMRAEESSHSSPLPRGRLGGGRPYDVFWLTTHCMDGDPQYARVPSAQL